MNQATEPDGTLNKKKKHAFKVDNVKFVVDTFYQPLQPLGRGAYGVVCSAKDKRKNQVPLHRCYETVYRQVVCK